MAKNEKTTTKDVATQTGTTDATTQTGATDAKIQTGATDATTQTGATDADKDAEAQKKANAAKLTELRAGLEKAKNRLANFDKAGMEEAKKTVMEANPTLWAAWQEEPAMWAKELREFELSILSPEEKQFRIDYYALIAKITALEAERQTLKDAIIAKYPEFFGAEVKKARAEKAASTTKGQESKPFTGTLLSKDDAKKRVEALIAQGITSESEIITSIYGNDFTIQGSKPRFQIHSIRLEMGLVPSAK